MIMLRVAGRPLDRKAPPTARGFDENNGWSQVRLEFQTDAHLPGAGSAEFCRNRPGDRTEA